MMQSASTRSLSIISPSKSKITACGSRATLEVFHRHSRRRRPISARDVEPDATDGGRALAESDGTRRTEVRGLAKDLLPPTVDLTPRRREAAPDRLAVDR